MQASGEHAFALQEIVVPLVTQGFSPEVGLVRLVLSYIADMTIAEPGTP